MKGLRKLRGPILCKPFHVGFFIGAVFFGLLGAEYGYNQGVIAEAHTQASIRESEFAANLSPKILVFRLPADDFSDSSTEPETSDAAANAEKIVYLNSHH